MVRLAAVAALLLWTAPARPAPPHPEPRVIVKVLSIQGPHDRNAVERSAREAWGKIVRCYKTYARGERGEVTLQVTIAASGRITSSERADTNLSNRKLVGCLTGLMQGVPMPKASSRSTARMSVHVAPGDPPAR